MLPEEEAIVAEVDDQCVVEFTTVLESLHDAADAIVDRSDGLAVAFVVGLDVEIGVVGILHPVAAVALILYPERDVCVVVGIVEPCVWFGERRVVVAEGMAVGW